MSNIAFLGAGLLGGAYPETTAVTETADRLYIQSLHAKGLGWLAK